MKHKYFCSLFAATTFVIYFAQNVNCVRDDLQPRTIPLCIRPTENFGNDPIFSQFMPIVINPSTYRKPRPLRRPGDPQLATSTDTFEILESIEFKKIQLDLASTANPQRVNPNKVLGDGNTMNQWIHIIVKAKVDLAGLIVQAIHGPVGLPFGNFLELEGTLSTRHKCKDCTLTALNFVTVPCTYRPKGALAHPNVYMFHKDYLKVQHETGNTYDSSTITNEVHINFNFIDLTCNRAATLQFLVIGVQSFGPSPVAEAVLTTTYQRPAPDSIDGIPYPFHVDFRNALLCGEAGGTNPYFNDFGSEVMIRYNFEYDRCAVNPTPAEFARKTCPPGPFRCDAIAVQDVRTESQMYIEYSTDPPCNCQKDVDAANIGMETPLPPAIPATFAPWRDTFSEAVRFDIDSSTREPIGLAGTAFPIDALHINVRESINTLSVLGENSGDVRVFHGIIMLIAFSFSSSISVFLSRFDKDILPGVGCCLKGMWLWGHIGFASLSLALTWAGVIILLMIDRNQLTATQSQRDKNPTLGALHLLFGFIAVLLFHFVFIFGWIRPVGRSFRELYNKVHAISGYSSKVCAVIAMLLCIQGLSFPGLFPIWILLPEFISLIFYAVSTLVQALTDAHMEFKSKRKICPYVEYKELPTPIPASCGVIRNLILVIHIVILVIIFGLIVGFWPDPMLRSYPDLIAPGNWEATPSLFPIPTTTVPPPAP